MKRGDRMVKMKIEICGPGCPRCISTEEIVKKVVKKMGIDAEIKKISDFNTMADLGVMMTPAVVVNGKVKIQGKIPTEEEVEKALKEK